MSGLDKKAKTLIVDTGIRKEELGHLAQALSVFLASSYTLYTKTQGFHWNVVGPHFYSLHKLTEELYQDLAEAVDEIAERIRALGYPAPYSLAQYQKLSHIDEETELLNAEDMVRHLVSDNEALSRQCKEAIELAEKARDQGTADMCTQRMLEHEKAAWMLRSIIAD